jgi:D-aminopeptidase
MLSEYAVFGKVALLVCGLVALVVWQWYEYRTGKKQSKCFSADGKPCKINNSGIDTTGINIEDFLVPEARREIFTQSNATTATGNRCRLRDLDVRLGGYPTGPNNAITDAGVLVGHTTLIEGEGALIPGKGPVRTGVTVVIPHRGDIWNQRPSAGHFVLNGNGSMTGLDWIKESGLLEGPIALTNTHSVGDVYSGLIRWMQNKYPNIGTEEDTYLPIVGECDDSPLNDIRGMHVKSAHVISALDGASAGPVPEGSVGAGTGMTCYEFKGGIGTSSRVVKIGDKEFTVGVLVNCNHGGRDQLKILGAPIGQHLEEELATKHVEGSITIIVATDAPLSSRQLDRVAKRAAMGLALTGATANHASGDFVVAFSNGRLVPRTSGDTLTLPELSDDNITEFFVATVEATEEAVLNSLCAADTLAGRDGNVSPALPLDRVRELLKQYGHIE